MIVNKQPAVHNTGWAWREHQETMIDILSTSPVYRIAVRYWWCMEFVYLFLVESRTGVWETVAHSRYTVKTSTTVYVLRFQSLNSLYTSEPGVYLFGVGFLVFTPGCTNWLNPSWSAWRQLYLVYAYQWRFCGGGTENARPDYVAPNNRGKHFFCTLPW